MDAQAIASAGVPVLCIDTCSILDIMRDPTRETAKPHDRQAAIDLVAAAESGRLICLMAEQVAIEFSGHDQPVQDEAARNLKKVREQVERINKLSAVFGAPGNVNLTHLDDHVGRARAVVGRWLAKLGNVTPSPVVPAKAFARVNAGIAPARRGKELVCLGKAGPILKRACLGMRIGGMYGTSAIYAGADHCEAA